MNSEIAPSSPSAIHRWIWRWHGYAGLFIVPFVFFMSLTGLPFVWQRELEDALHPDSRDLVPQVKRVPYEQQLSAARSVFPDQRLLKVRLDADPRHATCFTFGKASDPSTVAVNPYNGKVINVIREWTRLSFAAIRLHGLAFIMPYGSWLLELLACWGIVMCLTGMYLWFPTGKGGAIWGVFLPRLWTGGRTRWRDLHAVTGFYFGGILMLYFATGLPWTAFWGGKLLASVQQILGQAAPPNMSNDAGLTSIPPSPGLPPLPLDAFVQFAHDQRLPGYWEIDLPHNSSGTVHVHNRVGNSTAETHWQLNLFTAQPVGVTRWQNVPIVQKVVALGIDTHEGKLFGRPTQWMSTGLAITFMTLSAAAIRMWWLRRPQGRLDYPKSVPRTNLGSGFTFALVLLGLVMPLLGLSFVVLSLISHLSKDVDQP